MLKIITVLPRHYIGTAAEIAGITGVCSDTAYETDTDIYKHWNGTAWILSGIPFHVDRLTNAPDKQVGDFVTDGTWKVNGLDLSGVVPVGAIAIDLRLEVLDGAADSKFQIRRDAVNLEVKLRATTQAANVEFNTYVSLPVESDRLFDYYGSNLVFTSINVYVLGWTIQRCQ